MFPEEELILPHSQRTLGHRWLVSSWSDSRVRASVLLPSLGKWRLYSNRARAQAPACSSPTHPSRSPDPACRAELSTQGLVRHPALFGPLLPLQCWLLHSSGESCCLFNRWWTVHQVGQTYVGEDMWTRDLELPTSEGLPLLILASVH